jgi:PAS domain S-box-containing protein
MIEQITSLFEYNNNNLFVLSSYNPWLVIVSVLIAILASFMGFQVAYQAQDATPQRKNISLIIGSLALGAGVWSMHFIGMLALVLCTSISYRIDITILSVLPSIAASWIALNLMTKKEIQINQLILAGVLVGSGIGSMHYIGMAAMEMAPLLRYNLGLFVLSIVVAVSLAIVALWISFGLNKNSTLQFSQNIKMAISSVAMGGAIAGMHYTGMAAARFVMPPGLELSSQSNEISTVLAFVVTGITVIVLFVVLGANLIIRYKDISVTAMNNECRLIATMNTAIDGIITIDEKGIIISVNNAVSKLLGWSPDELIGNNVKIIVPMPHHHNHDQYISNYLTTRDAKIIGSGREVEALCKGGDKIPIRLGIGHVELNNQNLFVAFISDLRERKAMENSLRNKESKIRSLITNIPGIAYRCIDKPGWPNIFINDEVENILGYPAKDFLLPNPQRSISDFVHPEDMQNILEVDLRHENGYQLEFRIIDRFKQVKWMLGYGRSSHNEITGESYLDGFIMDITDRKKMESALISEKEKAEQAVAARTAFLANMSHEIRTPMNAIIGFSDILLDDELNNNQRKQLNTINQSAKSLLHILNDILDSAKLDKGKFQLEYRDFSLVEEVDSVVSTLWLQAQQKGLEINLEIAKKAQCFYHGVPDRLRQILTNLIGNAIKFTEQGYVNIEIKSHQPGFLTFSISDTGIGMTPIQLESIFDAFSQADESMSRRFGGTGLGTTISKQLVELMGGTISAKSEYEKGSTFEFSIPMEVATMSEVAKQREMHLKLPSLSILIVDDIEQNIDLLTIILKRNQHVVKVARNGEQALLQMENEVFDIVLMDIQMPIMDGLTASKNRRHYELENGLPRLPIIALTASVLPQDKQSAQQAGMDGFASKPIVIDDLMNEIANVLKLGDSDGNSNISITPRRENEQQKLSIDFEKGITLWGTEEDFSTEVIQFLNQIQDEIKPIKTLITKNDWDTLIGIAHKFKGVTGNLALNKLMMLFADLEKISRKQINKDALNVSENINTEIEKIALCIHNKSKNELSSKVMKANSITTKVLLETLVKLEERVVNNEFDDDLLDLLQTFETDYDEEINHIITACNDFDFELALVKVQALTYALSS